MKTKKYTNNLQKSSVLFLQLGLVLTLFTVYTAFELKTEVRTAVVIERPQEIDDPEIYVISDVIEIERKVKKTKVTAVRKEQPSSDFKIDDGSTEPNDTSPFVQPIDPDDDNPIDFDGLEDEGSGDDTLDPDGHLVNIANVQEVPIFPGCEKVKKEEHVLKRK